MHRINADFHYDSTATTVTSTVADVLRKRAGVCQDFAHLALACLRSHGIAARYVSGYLATQPPPGKERRRRRGRVARVGRGVDARLGAVARVRSDERPVGRTTPRHGGVGSRLRRRLAGEGRDLHQGEEVDAARAVDVAPLEDDPQVIFADLGYATLGG